MRYILFGICTLCFWATAKGQMPARDIDQLVEQTLETFDVPGIAVGIYQDGKTVYAKGHGIRSMKNNKPMNENTLVGVASNSKGFTCFALAMMVDEGKLTWDTKVREIIPEFRLADAWVTEQFTVRDLVTHRSGLTLGAGDLMFFPEGGDFTVDDVLAGLPHLEAESSFRSSFMYNNNMFIVAGEVLRRVSGLTWEDFMEQRILAPVGMRRSKAAHSRVTDHSNIIDAHTRSEGEVVMIPHDWSDLANPAGGIMSTVEDMLTWAAFLMRGGVTESGERLISEGQMHELWSLQTPIPVRANDDYNRHFRGYSLGWFVSDVKGGYKEVTHTGGLLGTVTQFTMIPELDLAIVVLTNQMSGAAFQTITNTIKDSYLGYPDRGWLQKYGQRVGGWLAYNDSLKTDIFTQVAETQKSNCLAAPELIAGTYTDPWFGDVVIEHTGSGYTIKSVRSPRLHGELLPYTPTSYVAKWADRSYDADCFLHFTLDAKGRAVSATVEPIAPVTDFSFDWVDLRLTRKD